MKQMSVVLFFCLIVQGAFAKSVEQLKQEILTLAKQNTSNVQNRPQVRAELASLTAELMSLSTPVDATTWATYSPGAWHQVWSDEADNSPAGAPKADLEKVFQVVTPQGRAVNFGQRILPNGQSVTFALEALGTVVQNVQTTKIVGAFSRGTGLVSGEVLKDLAEDILLGKGLVFTAYTAGEFPKGPINAQSDLTILFLDENLKIGTAPNVFSGQSEMFVLERVVVVP
jgi:hypothetical protein